jgi:hypothetical protein
MPLTQPAFRTPPRFLRLFGHSYFNTTVAVPDQTFRFDQQLQALAGVDKTDLVNLAITGGTLLGDNLNTASYVSTLQLETRPALGAPYVGRGGVYVTCWGVNDIGDYIPGSDYPAATVFAQVQAAFKHAYRAVISRYRSATVLECGGTDTETQWAFGAGFLVGTVNTFNSGTGYRYATSTTGATATFTIPADFPGGTIAFGFVGAPGPFGGTATVTGTFSGSGGANIVTSSMMPSGFNHGHYCRRFTNLPASDAGKTIIFTVTAVDASGNFAIDYAQIEATVNTPLVVVCNIPRLLNAAAYTSYTGSYWAAGGNAGSTGDTDIGTFNTAISQVVAEFDGLVQVADIDSVMNKVTANYGSDGIHPSALCTPLMAQRVYNTIQAAPTTTGNIVPDWRGTLGLRWPRSSQYWYAPEFTQITSTTLTAVTGQAFAFPILVSECAERWDGVAFEVTTAATGTGGTVRVGLYDDPTWTGYPVRLLYDWGTKATTGTGVQTMLTPTVNVPLDPGLFWMVILMEAQGGTLAGALRAFTGNTRLMPQSTSGAAPTIGTWAGNTCYQSAGMAAGGLPGRFPTGATVLTTAAPILLFRKY